MQNNVLLPNITQLVNNEREKINRILPVLGRKNLSHNIRVSKLLNIIECYNKIIDYIRTDDLKNHTEGHALENIRIKIFEKLHEHANITKCTLIQNSEQHIAQIVFSSGKNIQLETIPEVDKIEEEQNKDIKRTMTTLTEFLGLASKLVPEFDGTLENLQRFTDALNIVDTIKGEFENTAVELIKTKLKGNIRNIITTENTISAIIRKLKSSVKGESVEVLSAKLMNIKQYNKTANVFTKEIEEITKSLQNAYISDGLGSELASKYATNAAIKTLAKNANDEKVKIVMESGNFGNMNEAVAKFINVSNDQANQASVLFVKKNRNSFQRGGGHSNNYRPNYFQNRNRYNNRANYQNNNSYRQNNSGYNQHDRRNNNFNNNNNQNNRRNNNFNHNNNNNRRHVQVIQQDMSGNENDS